MKSPKNLMTRDQIDQHLWDFLEEPDESAESELDETMVSLLMSMVDAVVEMSKAFNLGLTGFKFAEDYGIDCYFSDPSITGYIYMDGYETPCLSFFKHRTKGEDSNEPNQR